MSNWLPTRKWWAATITGLGTIGVAWVQASGWTSTLTVTAIGFAVQRGLAWVLPNGDSDASAKQKPAVHHKPTPKR